MPKPPINPIIFWSFLGIAIVVIFIVGLITSRQCVDINGCSACWSTIDKNVKSEVCGENETCRVDAYVDQHNAVTNALLCACDRAKTGIDYPNTQMNNRIIEAYKEIYGSSPTVQEICESGNLVRLRY